MADTRYVVTHDGTRIAWDDAGIGIPVVLLHGLGSSRRRWDRLLPVLSEAGFRALRLDLRGFGESTGAEKPAGMDELMSDLASFVGELGLDRFHLLGHSLGGMLAQRYVVEHPERVASLVLASTTSHNGRRASAFARAMTLFAEHGFDQVMERDPEIRGVLADAFPGIEPPLAMLRIGVETPNPARANAWRACVGFSEKDRLAQIRCPVLVLHGSADPLIPFRAGELVHEAIAHSEWIEESGAGHSLPTERAESFNRAVLDFLARQKREPGAA
jgi:pimeloyl-ACP methyl ester carboxylesterase